MRWIIAQEHLLGLDRKLLLAILGLAVLVGSPVQADRIRIKGGSEIQGVVRTNPDRPDVILVQTLNGSNLIEFPPESILEVIEEDDILDEYDGLLSDLPETAEAHHQLGLWCEGNRLSGLAAMHHRRAVEIDKDFAPAHKKLGHVEHKGDWVTYDELRTAQGLVKHQGQWIPREDLSRIEARNANRAEHETATRQIRVLRQGLGAPSIADRGEAERRLFEMGEPRFVPALVEVLGEDTDPAVRELLVRILGSIEGPEASRALIARSLNEPDNMIRRGSISELSRRGEPETAKVLTSVLGSKNLRLVGRAAQALQALGVTDAIPKLIAALVRVERRLVWVPTSRPATGSGPVSGLNVTGRSIPVVTGPTVGDGAVAYGATSVPFGSGVGLNLGSGGMVAGPPELRVVTNVHRHPDVLAALESLTSQNFGYDQASWKRWLAQFHREPAQEPSRRVPQP